MRRTSCLTVIMFVSLLLSVRSPYSFATDSNAEEQFRTGMQYYEKQDYDRAFAYFQISGEVKGYAPAQNMLGVCYRDGLGVEQNLAEAEKFFKLAAEQRDAEATANLKSLKTLSLQGKNTVVTYYNGDVYEGEWKDDKKNGQGIYRFSDGRVYEGEWKDDNRNGLGTMTWPNGVVYEGEWKDNKMNGQGKMTLADGSSLEGEWKDNKMNGQGKMIAYGDVYEGEWKDGKKNGQGIYRFSDGRVYEGEWKDDKMNGEGTYTWPYGQVKKGKWRDGIFAG